MTEWQPIETAPKDGTEILACAKGWDGFAVVAYINGNWSACADGLVVGDGDVYVTHWVPLPEPPQGTE